ncbi:MAG: hypothetical protein ABI091_23340 [Ferruginibacter sp.]
MPNRIIKPAKKHVNRHYYDQRGYVKETWRPGIFALIVEGVGLEEAKARVTINRWGYKYNPSPEYRRFISKHYTNRPVKG